jgi:A/G-specific adenine glycosylase
MKDGLLAWYSENGRDLPWRKTTDPYAILVSEVMLQQKPLHRVESGDTQGEHLFLP